ncbi:peptidoglycan DD-metalloendopeptidase family protein [Methylobacter sp.]|uniref:peptidoglycan DD-metalloendopeptidase family protein n=1 Tax=Methylobacter sp. TaxID=2051955 RepID=UPI002FDE1A57
MKNKIYTSLLFGISLAFSVTGHTQTKPARTHSATKTISTAPLQSNHTKPNNKKNPAAVINTKPSNTKAPATPKSANKKDSSIAITKPTTQKKSTATSKSTAKKQPIVSAKLKNNKQAIASSKSSHKTDATVSVESATRKHTVISSKSIESVSIKQLNHKKLSTHTPANLDLDNAESDPFIHINNDRQLHRTLIDRPQPTTINTAHVSIETSLFLDGLEAGLSKELILQLTDIFAWDIDFASNLRPGDQFTVVYGKKIVDGKEADSDEIIAAEFINQGSSYTAVRYINEFSVASYYTQDGQSMQRAFLTTPVDFAKISSPFDMHRKHPILNRIRAHKGIDYAARIGTPVKATGDGIVTFSGSKGAYGQVVTIQHNDHYETLYAHMSAFKKGLTVGDHVKQGDVIGFVGQTGLATGPHLHYEFHVDGLYRDPETVKIPHSMPISSALLADFNDQTQPFFTQLIQAKAKSLLAKTPAIAPGIALPPASMQPSHYD